MIKRCLSVLIAVLMIITSLSGCGNASLGTSNASTGALTGDDKVEIEIYHCTFNIASADSAEVQAIEDSINNYIADKINVKIKLTDLGQGEYEDKCNLAIFYNLNCRNFILL